MDNINNAIYFLKKWSSPPWHLTAIDPKTRHIEAVSLKNEDEVRGWLNLKVQSKNIYFQVNELLHEVKTKAKKADIKQVNWLHVDVDLRPGEDFKEGRQRILNVLQGFKPSPTVIIDSGNGFQGFWKLDGAVKVDGDLERVLEIEAYNRQIEIQLGGDACYNVDRIMRLPGTINLPNKKKMQMGRTAQPAKIVEEHSDRIYSLDQFTPAPKTSPTGEARDGSAAKIPEMLPVLTSVEELPDTVKPITKEMIVQGDPPDDPNKYPSRSEALFAVVCDLIRADVSAEIIASLILDEKFAISESVLDKRDPRKYALRQIERAKEFCIEPWLMKVNEEYAVVLHDGGKCRVITELMDYSLRRPTLVRMTFEDFRNAFRNKRVVVGEDKNGNPAEKPVGHWWLDHPKRREYETIVFAPNREIKNAYNLWQGYGVEASPGKKHELFLEHLKENICTGNKDYYDYLIKWMARAVQMPDTHGEVAVVMRGARGTGKSFFAKNFGKLFGRHYLQVSNSHHLVGNFNAHLRDCVILFADEAFYAGDKKHESILKTLITEETLVIEAKGRDAVPSPNYTHLIMASNDDWVVPAGAAERRFFALEVGDMRQKDSEYFGQIQKNLDAGGRENLLDFLLKIDLDEFDVRLVPNTPTLRDQKLRTLKQHEHVFLEILQNGFTPDPDEYKDHPAEISVQAIINLLGQETNRSLETIVGQFLNRQVETHAHGRPVVYTRRVGACRRRMYRLKPLEALRKAWAEFVDALPLDGDEWRYKKAESGNQNIPF